MQYIEAVNLFILTQSIVLIVAFALKYVQRRRSVIERRKVTEGKRLGKISFWISEIISILLTIGVVIVSVKSGTIDGGLVGSLLLFQSGVFITVWGSKATANFAKRGQNMKQDETV